MDCHLEGRLGADDRGDDAADDVSAARDVPADHRRTAGRGAARGPRSAGLLRRMVRLWRDRPRGNAGLRWAAARYAWFIANGWMVGVAVLAGAGLFQWSALKYRCLDECRSPFAFVGARWHGRSPARDAFRIGLDHGILCVGCCWALMLVMFVVGTGSVGRMVALAAVMVAEKNLPWGRRLRTPLGLGLIGWAGAIAIVNA